MELPLFGKISGEFSAPAVKLDLSGVDNIKIAILQYCAAFIRAHGEKDYTNQDGVSKKIGKTDLPWLVAVEKVFQELSTAEATDPSVIEFQGKMEENLLEIKGKLASDPFAWVAKGLANKLMAHGRNAIVTQEPFGDEKEEVSGPHTAQLAIHEVVDQKTGQVKDIKVVALIHSATNPYFGTDAYASMKPSSPLGPHITLSEQTYPETTQTVAKALNEKYGLASEAVVEEFITKENRGSAGKWTVLNKSFPFYLNTKTVTKVSVLSTVVAERDKMECLDVISEGPEGIETFIDDIRRDMAPDFFPIYKKVGSTYTLHTSIAQGKRVVAAHVQKEVDAWEPVSVLNGLLAAPSVASKVRPGM